MISVIMLTYNREKYVENMIQDVLQQTLQDFEFVIVNNGSTDNTAQVLERYAAQDERIKIVTITKEEAAGTYTMSGTGEQTANTSIGRARNIGFRASSGEYIAFVDDDDRIERDYLEFLYGMLQEEGADISMCGASEGDGVTRHPQCLFDERMVLTGQEAVALLLGRKYIRAGMPTKMYRREILEAFPFEEKYKNEDIHTQYKYLLEAKKMVIWGVDKYYCYRHGGNISGFTGSGNASGWTYETMHNYLGAYRRRAQYVVERVPELEPLARYTVYSFMIDMVAIVEKYDLAECRSLEQEMVRALAAGAEEFLQMPQIRPEQVDNMHRYVLNITLSIIITTCNRAYLLMPHLREILRSKRQDLEVLVLVDESTDDTVEQLQLLQEELFRNKDYRLWVIQNPQRMGFMYNYLNGLHMGRGKYCQNINDRDSIVAEDLDEYVEYLTGLDADVVLTVGKSLPQYDVTSAYDRAIMNSVYSHSGHKTWSKRLLREQEKVIGPITVENAESGYNAAESAFSVATDKWSVYPGAYAIHPPKPEQAAKIKQERNTGFHGRIYFTPESYLQQVEHFVDNPYVGRDILKDYILGTYCVYFGFALGGYYKVLQNPFEMERYQYTPPSQVDWKQIAKDFEEQFTLHFRHETASMFSLDGQEIEDIARGIKDTSQSQFTTFWRGIHPSHIRNLLGKIRGLRERVKG